MAHLLVTNDFPPKIGGIQFYLWELWRRLPADEVVVLTTAFAGSASFDAAAPMQIIRTAHRLLLPTPSLLRQIEKVAKQHGITHIVLDPALPVGWLGPLLAKRGFTYSLVLHGAEITVPGRIPGLRQLLAPALRGAKHIIAAGGYPLAEAERAARSSLPATVIPPGVDTDRFTPPDHEAHRRAIRARFNLPAEAPLMVGGSRLVPRKGFDVLIDAVAQVSESIPDIVFVLSGTGRDEKRLAKRAARALEANPKLDIRLVGRLPDSDLVDLLRAADIYAMLCRNRWGGLEQEGFGIVFLEAAACGIPQIAGASGGSHEAVINGQTGVVVARPKNVGDVANAISALLGNRAQRSDMGEKSRLRVEADLNYDILAARLYDVLSTVS
jgi:phosphatidyl-myo-inositol dimannoside synthase